MESFIFDSKRMLLNDSEIEAELCSFYEQLVKEMYIMSHLEFRDIHQSLYNIRSYKNRELEKYNAISFDEPADRLAYIFAYCLVHSTVMCDRFSGMLKTNPSLLKKITSMAEINLCFLGGGPGFEAVSLCKILSHALSKLTCDHPPLQVHITIIDIYNGWENDAKLILESAEENLLSPENIKIDLSFIEADLTDDFSEEVKKAIKRSHFVIMFKFLSDVDESSYKKCEITMLVKKILKYMVFEACLFYLDASGGKLFKEIDCLIDGHQHTAKIYGPCLHNCHKLSLNTVQTYESSLKHIFRYLKCTNRITVSCSAWVKLRHTIKINEVSTCTSTKANSPSVSEEELQKVKPKKVKIKKLIQSPARMDQLAADFSVN